jgi:putative transcriptional regulator
LDFFNYKTPLTPARGRLLISEPFLPDPHFGRSVVLLCEHNEEGSFGFILNHSSHLIFSDLVDGMEGFKEEVFIGGPVQNDTLHFLHRNEKYGGTVVAEGIYWGGDFEHVSRNIHSGEIQPQDFRFFIGYSGWSAGQLEEELEANSWMVVDGVTRELVFDVPYEAMWKTVLKQMGGRFGPMSNYPIDPRLN